MRIFLDANVLFSAAYDPRSSHHFLIQTGSEAGWVFITCDWAWLEAERNLSLKRQTALRNLRTLSRWVETIPAVTEGNCPIPLPDKDKPIFLSAVHARATHLLTGDLKDFGPHMNKPHKTQGILIQSTAHFLNLL
jgi:uncharacterized protein